MEKYLIFYPDIGVTQTKNLISQELHDKGKDIHHENPKKADELRKKYYSQFGIYFTNKSALGKAINSGILVCNNQECNVIISKLLLDE